jgi:hypothetical protein
MYLEQSDSVRRYRRAFERMYEVALGVAESKHLLRQVARRYGSER